MATKAKAKDGKENGNLSPLDIDALIDAKIKTNRDELRKQVIQESFNDYLKNASKDNPSLETFLTGLKNTNKEILEYAHQQPLRDIAAGFLGLGTEKRRRGPRRGRRAPNGINDELKQKVLDFLKGKTDKFTVGQLSKEMSVDSKALKKPLGDLRKDGGISSEGDRRSMRYFAK